MLYTVCLQIISIFTPPWATKPALALPKFLVCIFMKSLLWIFNTIKYFYIASVSKGISFSFPSKHWKIKQQNTNKDPYIGAAKVNSFVPGLFRAVLFSGNKLTPTITILSSEAASYIYCLCIPLDAINVKTLPLTAVSLQFSQHLIKESRRPDLLQYSWREVKTLPGS